jgi:7-cyano-7-deazaguanine synthase
LDAASTIASNLRIQHRVVDVTGLATIFGSNALTDRQVDVPHGEYSPQTMQVTVVPNRNMIMLSIATGWAIATGFDSVAFGAHSGDYTPYPDCQPAFAAAVNAATHVCDRTPVEILAPFVRWSKQDIVRHGKELNVPFDLTWSCYQGGENPCGLCSTCLDRAGAFENGE